MQRREFLSLAGLAAARAAGAPTFDVRSHGAAGDGKAKDTAAVQRAIDACAAAGGGTVYLPPGTYLSGTVVLKPNVTFYLEAGATLLGSTDLADYLPQSGPPLQGDANAKHLLFARDAANVTVRGPGRIDGQGKAFWEPANRQAPKPEDAWRDVATYDWKPLDRPSPMVEFFNCQNLRIEDVTLANSSGWTLRPVECDTVLIRGIKIRNPVIGPNTDGIDPTCCRNVFIADCDIATGDDAICLKSEAPYGRLGLTKNITITNCVLTCCCSGLTFGTATNGGFENVTFSNSVIYNENVPLNARVISGIAVEMVDGGWVEGVVVSNIRMQRVRTPIFIRLGNRRSAGRLRGVSIDNVQATGAILTSSITGLPGHYAEDVTLANIHIETEEAGRAEWVNREIPEVPGSYPEARMFGRLPAWGLYCRHVSGLRLENLRLAAAPADERPALHCEDVKNLRVGGLEASAPASAQPWIRMVDVRDAVVTACSVPDGTSAAVEVSGPGSGDIRAVGNDFARAGKTFDVRGGAPAGAVVEVQR
ncbi:MAG: glycoside hydrolase family 28 protein [Acidobacteriia bacterium]|nr:glycoside hydrolase family 28 protein [Terriglobia bacterium]